MINAKCAHVEPPTCHNPNASWYTLVYRFVLEAHCVVFDSRSHEILSRIDESYSNLVNVGKGRLPISSMLSSPNGKRVELCPIKSSPPQSLSHCPVIFGARCRVTFAESVTRRSCFSCSSESTKDEFTLLVREGTSKEELQLLDRALTFLQVRVFEAEGEEVEWWG